MSADIETSVAQVGLRDFLFYVVPGAVLLTGALAFEGIGARDLQPYLGISSSIAAILASYILGQFAYPAAYLVRFFMGKRDRLISLHSEEDETFRRACREVATEDSLYFAVEIFRYRTMARFCSVMILPIVLVALGIAFGGWHLNLGERITVMVLAGLICFGFLWRYGQYECRYRSSLVKAKQGIEEGSTVGSKQAQKVPNPGPQARGDRASRRGPAA